MFQNSRPYNRPLGLRYFWALVCALVGLLGIACPARAHDPALSGIRVLYRSKDVVVSVTTPLSRLLRSEGVEGKSPTPDALEAAVRRRLHLRLDSQEMFVAKANVIVDKNSDILSWQVVLSGSPQTCEVLERLYPEDPASKTVVVLLREGQVVQETLLDAEHPSLLRSQPAPSPFQVGLRYIREGILHIFGGPDHICFVLGLLLLGGTFKSLLKTVTAFTLAHSITLSIAVLGIWNPSPRWVEPLIALSIIAIAAENWRAPFRKSDPRPWLAFGFGLIHGFGFAGALTEVGLPKEALGVALASFNGGVEIGQALIVAAVAPALSWFARKHEARHRQLVLGLSVAIALAGLYWLGQRL